MELDKEAAEWPWCRPFLGALQDNTDSEDETSEFEDDPDLFVAGRIYDKKPSQRRARLLFSFLGGAARINLTAVVRPSIEHDNDF